MAGGVEVRGADAHALGQLHGLADADLVDELDIDAVDRLRGGDTQVDLAIGRAAVVLGGVVPDAHRTRSGVLAVGQDPLLQGLGEHEGLERRAGLASGTAAQRSEGEVDPGGVEVAPTDHGLDEAGERLHRHQRHLQWRFGVRKGLVNRTFGLGLHPGIERGVDAQALLIDGILPVAVGEVALEVVDEVGVGGLGVLPGVHEGGAGGRRLPSGPGHPHPLGDGFGVLLLGDHPLFEHGVEDDQAPLLGEGGVASRLVAARRRDEPGQQRRLGEGQVGDRLVEVGLRRRSHPIGALAEVDPLEVAEQDLVLVDLAVELAGHDGLAHLARQRALTTHVGVLDVLLGDGGAALHHPVVADVGGQGTQGAEDVDAAVGVEPAVFAGHHRLLQHLGDFARRHRLGGLELPEDADLVPVDVVDAADAGLDAGSSLGEAGRQREEQQGGEHHQPPDQRDDDGGDDAEHQPPPDGSHGASVRSGVPAPSATGAPWIVGDAR